MVLSIYLHHSMLPTYAWPVDIDVDVTRTYTGMHMVPPNSMHGRFNSSHYFREVKHPAGPFHIRTRDNVFATCNGGSSLNNVQVLYIAFSFVYKSFVVYIYIDIIDIKFK